jgi:glyoxylate reductase
MSPRIFVTQKLPQPALDRLREVCDYVIGCERGPLDRSALLAGAREADGMISMLTDLIDREVITNSERLRIIANVAVGYNNIDLTSASQRGIVVSNTPDVLTDATADLTWALILAVTRRIVEADFFTRGGRFKTWDFDLFLGSSLTGKTLGIIGYGRIGKAVARRAAGFGLNVLYCGRDEIAFRDDRPRAVPAPRTGTSPLSSSARFDGLAARRAGFHQLLEQSDIITLHTPLATATRHLIDRAALERVKPTAYLINTARGPVVDEVALAEALAQGKLAGAGLDVYEREPEITPALMTLPNVVLLPHIGSATYETRTAMAMLAVENVIDHFSGRTPRNAI